MTLCLLTGVFILLLLLNVPIAFAIGLSALSAMLCSVPAGPSVSAVAQRMAVSVQSFPLLAIPFFILAGHLMTRGGLARRLIDFARVIAGPLPGALAVTNILASMMFGAVSGSASAAASGIGGFMIPAMEKDRYDRAFSAALTATAATSGLLIPPSNIMIVYAMVAGGVSVGALFVAGYLPGILLGLCLIPVALYMTIRKGYGVRTELPEWGTLLMSALGVIPVLLLVAIVMGGIVYGTFTATEASAIAVAYAFVLGVFVYREVGWKDMPELLIETASTTGLVFLLIGTSVAMSWIFAYADVPGLIATFLKGLSDNPYVILFLINLILLFVGTFMDMTPAVLIFTPIFLPMMMGMARDFGLSPEEMKYHFGIVLILNLCIGLCTPPVGTVLFIGCSVAKIRLADMLKPILPFFVAMVAALLLVTYLPRITLWLPELFGLIK